MKYKNQVLYSLSQICYWAIYCSLIGYASVYLIEQGFQDASIGLLLAFLNLLSVALQFLISHYLSSKISLRKIIAVSLILMLIMAGLIAIINLPSLIQIILYSVMVLIILTLLPYINSLGLAYEVSLKDIDFSLARGFGSLAFALTSFGLGKMLLNTSSTVLPLVAGILTLLLFLVIVISPKEITIISESTQHQSQSIYKKYPKILLFMISIILVFTYHNFINAFLPQIVASVNGDSAIVGTALMIAGIMELPAMIYYSKLTKYKSNAYWLIFSLIAYVVRSIVYLGMSSYLGVYIAQVLQAISFALLLPAVSYYLKDYFEDHEQIQGQTAFTIAMTVGGIGGNLLGGTLLSLLGVKGMLLVGSLFTFVSVTLMIVFVKDSIKKERS